MQIDGYSLDVQKTKMKAFCDYNEYEIAGEYEDAGKSGKSIEGRIAFNQMMDDIKSGKDEVSYVLVFKFSRFGRNAADVLATLQVMQDFGVNLICVEDGIDSSKDAGKLMISVLSAVAEIERENIRVQTMEGRMQKAREGKWNGGFAPYGYALIDGKLVVNEEEAVAIRTIFDQYVNTDLGANGIAKYLENHGIHKIARQNGKNPLFDAALIRRIIQNPVYSGKISYGRRRTEKVHGTRNEYRQVEHIQNIGPGCKVSRKYEIEGGIESLLENFNAEDLFSHIEGNSDDVIDTPNETKDYKITIDYKKTPQKVIAGSFDKNGLPDDFEEFADAVFDFIRFYGWGEILDPSVYGKVKRRTTDYIYCSVVFEEGQKSYYYLTDDDSIEIGDFVLVPAGKDNHEAVVQVVDIEYFSAGDVPLPAEKTKHIIRKCTDEDFDLPEPE